MAVAFIIGPWTYDPDPYGYGNVPKVVIDYLDAMNVPWENRGDALDNYAEHLPAVVPSVVKVDATAAQLQTIAADSAYVVIPKAIFTDALTQQQRQTIISRVLNQGFDPEEVGVNIPEGMEAQQALRWLAKRVIRYVRNMDNRGDEDPDFDPTAA